MSGFGILFLIFGTCVLLVGLYMYTGHPLKVIEWRAAFKNMTKEKWINVGKWTMITSVIPFILAIIGLFLDI